MSWRLIHPPQREKDEERDTTGRRCLWRDGWESHLIIYQAHDLPLRKPSGGESWVLRETPPGHVGTEQREDMSWARTVSTTLFKLEGHRLYTWTKRGPGTGSRSPRNHCPTSWSSTETASPLSWGSFNRMPGRPQPDPPYRNGLFLLTSLPPGPCVGRQRLTTPHPGSRA